jgi:hypothetical protein
MKIQLIKKNGSLFAVHNSDYEKIKKIKDGSEVVAEIKVPRNYQFHKKFFALLNIGFENTKSWISEFDYYRMYILMKSGYYVEIKTPNGSFFTAKSISFANMDNDEFEKLFKTVLQTILIDTGATEEDILDNLLNFM